ncbi:MAG TPA: hypothetical protein DCK93_17480 [Blastocatellia bacterium]|nr:hypothetical protein [Blastocatellia bacterium]HAF24667.1 hypothetical protein [Blastocatellia bacterium]
MLFAAAAATATRLFLLRFASATVALVKSGSAFVGSRLLVWNIKHLLDDQVIVSLRVVPYLLLPEVEKNTTAYQKEEYRKRRDHPKDCVLRI